ncbi:MAG: hypothetical protein ACTHU0_20305 [Kofleriaceae bacterium]
MRLAAVALWLTACTIYDPLDQLSYREYRDTASAIRAILEESPGTRVFAVGEYHATRRTDVRDTPLARFTREIIGELEPHAQHLVVEAWLDDACGSAPAGQEVQSQIVSAIDRAPATQRELATLVETSRQRRISTHGLPVTCIELSAMLDPRGRVDFYRLLLLVTEKLHDTTRALLAQGHRVIVYGGALHNDLYPRYLLDEVSYAQPLARELGGGVLEIDLAVPEIVAPMRMVRREAWFPLLGLAAPERVVVWSRGPGSYVVILPAQSTEIAKVARSSVAM